MAGSDVVSDVSRMLETVLTGAMSSLTPPPAPIAQVHDLVGVIPTAPALLTLFLYEVAEDPSLRNRPRIREAVPTGGVQLRKPPMALILRYLLTAWGGDRVTEQRMLGRVMHVLYDDATLSGPALVGSLAGLDEPINVTLSPLTLEERTRVWWSMQRPYRLSLNYELRVANLDSEAVISGQPVLRRALRPFVAAEVPQ